MTALVSSRDRFAEALATPGHVAYYSTRYDGRGGIAWEDDGGLSCLCGWSAPPAADKHGRPWGEWYKHKADLILADGVVVDVAALADDETLVERLSQTASVLPAPERRSPYPATHLALRALAAALTTEVPS
jgi:hypothetical protein